jgi:hypothetical protein
MQRAQRTYGNREVSRYLQRRRAQSPSPAAVQAARPAQSGGLILQRTPAITDDGYTSLADQLHEAMEGLGTDERAIYAALQEVQKDAAAIEKLKKAYGKYGDLETDLKDELSGEELRMALDLINPQTDPKKGAMVGVAPTSDDEYKAAAKRLYTAMEGMGTDEEAIYAALVPFNKDATKLNKLKTTYQSEFSGGLTGKGLEADIKDELSGDELGYALDLLNAPTAPGTKAKRIENTWEEQVEGRTYGLTSRYAWEILGKEIRITVKLQFTGLERPSLVEQMFSHIRSIWNKFDAVSEENEDWRIAINFDPQSVTSGADNQVKLAVSTPEKNRSDAGTWLIDDPDINGTAAHEFGHMIGLEDEYRRTHADYKRLLGKDPPPGQTTGDAPPETIAKELHDALVLPTEAERSQAANAVITKHGLQQGDFSQKVAAAYQTAYGVEIVTDIAARLNKQNSPWVVDPFMYTSTSMMGDMSEHDHPVEPRHVREFVAAVQQAKGGKWRAEER